MRIISSFRQSLILQIIIGIILGCLLAVSFPTLSLYTGFLGELFIKALKSIAPLLVLVLVASAIANQNTQQKPNIKPIFFMYLTGTLAAGFLAVAISFAFPLTVNLLDKLPQSQPPEGIRQVLMSIVFKLVDNPVTALIDANYLGLIVWGVGLGITLTKASDSTKKVFLDISSCISRIVTFIIRFAPLGIFGLTMQTVSNSGLAGLASYVNLLAVLLLAMALFALVVNPAIVYLKMRRNPYPLLFICLKESGTTAFFTRSSAANIPVNMALCKKLKLDEDTYSVSIPLGATINTGGAAITISILTLCAVNTLGIHVDFFTAVLLAIVSALCACGASGVAGGSLLLIPLACSLFGINNEVAMNMVAIGFMIGVIQDAVETAVNSSTDVFYTAAVYYAKQARDQKSLI